MDATATGETHHCSKPEIRLRMMFVNMMVKTRPRALFPDLQPLVLS